MARGTYLPITPTGVSIRMRRDFLKLCSLAGLGFSLPVQSARTSAEPYAGPFYVVFNASGGWDTTYLMDPKGVNGINRLYKEDAILEQGPFKVAPTEGRFEQGMSNEDFFKRYGEELLVLNGLDYSINNHTPCMRYMATGKLDSLVYPTFAALVASCKGSDCPLAFLTFGNYSNSGNLVPMSRVPYLPSLKLLANADGVHGNPKAPYNDAFVNDRIDQALREQLDLRLSADLLPRTERAQNMLFGAQISSKALKRVAPFIPDRVPKGRLEQQAEIALAAFRAGVAVSANLNIGQFDSHANNDRDQMKLIPEFLGGIDYFMRRAEEHGIRDKVVVVIQSEMGRTPHYNQGEGKDHWSIGSIMFMGQGIRGRRMLGATGTKQELIPLNPKTLAVDIEKGIRVRPEHIHRALREHAGIQEHAASKRFPITVDAGSELSGLFA